MKGSHAVCLIAFAILILGIKQRACAQGSLRSDARSAIPVVDDTFLTFDPVKGKTLSLAAPSHEITVNDDWRFELHARLWAMGIDGDVGARGRSASVDASFLDVMDASDSLIGVAGRIEVGIGPWGFFVDGLYDKIGVDDATGPFGLSDIDVTIDMGIVDIGALYRLGDWPFARTGADPARKSVTLDAYAGARCTTLALELDAAGFAPVDRDRDWIDPIVGAKLVLPISDEFHATVWGDVGGFGVSSDFTWSIAGAVSYGFPLFGLDATAFAGYRALGEDHSSGRGADAFVWDVTLSGPIISLDIRF